MLQEAVLVHRPDLIYMRYPGYDAHVLQFVRTAPPVVFEIQTKFDRELPPAAAAAERVWAGRVLAESAGLVAVTPEILAYERARAGWSIPGHVMTNGADPASIPFTTPALAPDRFDVLCVASFYDWHGVDRVICGMAAESDVPNMHLGLHARVHFAGLVPPHALDPWYARAHLGLGVLAPQRKQLTELAALKHREYALRGLPFVTAGIDVDFPLSTPWLRQVDSSDGGLSPRALRAFALGWTHVKRRQQIRTWAEANVAWSAKIAPTVAFLRIIAADRRTLAASA
jgi:hypothetical protein